MLLSQLENVGPAPLDLNILWLQLRDAPLKQGWYVAPTLGTDTGIKDNVSETCGELDAELVTIWVEVGRTPTPLAHLVLGSWTTATW